MLTFRRLEKTITGQIDGKPFNVPRTEETEKVLSQFLENGATSEEVWNYLKDTRKIEIAQSNGLLVYVPAKKEYYLQLNGKRSKMPIPISLVKIIETSYDKNMDFMPIVKAWLRLLDNPRLTPDMINYFQKYLSTTYTDVVEVDRLMKEEGYSREAAVELCTYPDIAITQEGLLATYKVAERVTWKYEMVWNEETQEYEKKKKDAVTRIPAVIDPVTGEILEPEKYQEPAYKEDYVFTPAICKDGDRFYSGTELGYVYKIGEMQYLPKDAKRNLENTFGGGGLYIGGLNYIDTYRRSNNNVLTCFANPSDILSFQDDGTAFRTDALFPNNVWDSDVPLKGIYHSSDYGKLSEDRLIELLEQATKDGITIKEYQDNLPSE